MMIVVYGQDSFRALNKIREMKEKFIREIDELDTSFGDLDGKSLTMAELSRALATDSLFAKKRLLLIRNVLANKSENFLKELADYLAQFKTENIIIFYEERLTLDKHKKPVWLTADDKTKALTKAQQKMWLVMAEAYLMYYPLLNEQELAKWLKQKLGESGLAISRGAERILLSAGPDLWLINNEINKLIAYKLALADGLEINENDLRDLVSYDTNQSIFELTDAIGNKDKAKAIDLMKQQLANSAAPLYLLSMLNRQFKIILSVRQGLDNGLSPKTLADSLKLHPYVLQKSINQARNYNLTNLKAIIGTLAKIDYNFKSGKWSVEMMLDVLVARL